MNQMNTEISIPILVKKYFTISKNFLTIRKCS